MMGMMASINPNGEPPATVHDLTVEFEKPGAWLIANQTIDRTARPTARSRRGSRAASPPTRPRRPAVCREAALLPARQGRGLPAADPLQPASRYWTLQAIESAIFLARRPAGRRSFWWLRNRVT